MHRREVSPPTLMVSVAFVPVKWLLRSMRHHRGDIFKGAPVVPILHRGDYGIMNAMAIYRQLTRRGGRRDRA